MTLRRIRSGLTAILVSRWTTTVVLALILSSALILRLWLSPAEGYGFDVGTNKGWSYSAVAVGVGQSYTMQMKGSMNPNYPPMSMLIFDTTGWIYMKTLSPNFDIDATPFQSIIKLPAILADLMTALMLCVFVAVWKKNRWLGVLAAAVYAFHPVTIHDSAIWGQTDALYTMFMVAAFGTLAYGFGMAAGLLMALAVMTKLQAIACAPLFIVIGLRSGWRTTVKALIGGVAGIALVLLPFWLKGFLGDAIHIYTSSVGFYSSVSSAAYNVWWALYADAAGNMHDTDMLFHIASFRSIGLVLFAISALFPFAILWRGLRSSPRTGQTLPFIFFAAAFTMYGFFLWNTQMHERYAFAVVSLALIVAFTGKRAAWLYVLITGMIYMNLLGWLHAGFLDKRLYEEFPMLDVFVASALVIFFFNFAGIGFGLRRLLPKPSPQSARSARNG